MKLYRLLILIFLCFLFQRVSAQTSEAIAADLNKLFEKLGKFDLYDKDNDLIDTINSQLDNKISFYIKTAPGKLAEAFPKLGAVSSADGLLSILSWDDQSGGTQHSFANLFLYKTNGHLNYINSDTLSRDMNDEFPRYYNHIYSLIVGSKTYYLATYEGILDLNERMEGIRIFAIEGGKLNDKVKLIKTSERFTYKLRYRCIFERDDTAAMNYNSKSKEITFPVVNKNERITGNSIAYKFTGQYFERVKN